MRIVMDFCVPVSSRRADGLSVRGQGSSMRKSVARASSAEARATLAKTDERPLAQATAREGAADY
jgi:hypothetical protein